ncbi:MAG TPA: ATP-binding protein [candidate division Zixibacteria bacterium]
MKLRLKLFLTYLLLSLLCLFIAGILIVLSEQRYSRAELERNMLFETELLSKLFVPVLTNNMSQTKIDSLTKELGSKIEGRITVINKTGKVLGDSYESEKDVPNMENHINRPEVARALRGDVGKIVRFSYTIKTDMLYVACPIKDDTGIIGVVRLAFPIIQLRQYQNRIMDIVLIGLLIALAFSLLLSFVFSSKITKPLRQMMRVSKKISQGDFTQKVKVKTKDEIGELSQILDQMSLELSGKIDQINEDKSRLDSILSNMTEGVLALDHRGKVVLANDALSRMFELDAVYGRLYYEAIRDYALNQFIQEVLSSKQAKNKEISFFHPQEKVFMVQSTLVGSQKEDTVFAIFVFYDITELKKTEKIRKDFVANVSHELKTPLTSIKGFVEALQDGAINNTQQANYFLSIISQHTERMNKIISDLLQLSLIEAEEFQLKIEPFAIKEVIEGVASMLKNSAEKKSQNIEMKLYSEEQRVLADKYRINQALTNLVENAIRYTPEKGTIKIQTEDKGDLIEIAVMDNGIGIPSKDLPRIFERFYTVDKGRSRESGGTGLGLSIVKHIIEAHNGKIHVESKSGKGSKFSFDLKKA